MTTRPRGRSRWRAEPAPARRRAPAAAAVVLVAAALMSGCELTTTPGASGPTTAPASAPEGILDAATARSRLGELRVAVPARLDGYDRECDEGGKCVFGRPWEDTDGDGCDQRSQVLARDLSEVVRKPGRCGVTAGKLLDPYTGEQVTKVSDIQIDHVVALAEMWRSGAAAWPPGRRVQAANDLRNLLAVKGKENQAKGDKTPDKWLPKLNQCLYARIYVSTKLREQLIVTAPEVSALRTALGKC